MEEVDSAYCPSCLSFYDVTTASSADVRGYCPKATCRACPACRANLAVKIDSWKSICYYTCGHCGWTSEGCGVTSPAPTSTSDKPTREELRSATDGLGTTCRQRIAAISKSSNSSAKTFATLVEGWAARSKEVDRKRREDEVTGRSSSRSRRGRRLEGDGPGGWCVESLEEMMQKRREEERSSVVAPLVKGIELKRLTLQDGVEDAASSPEGSARPSAEESTSQTVLGPGVAAAASSKGPESLLPLPVALRPRKSRRCRAELAASRTGILVKPKLNPLEGDSSLRSGHGQWWKKDSSAIHVVPRVKVVRHGKTTLPDSRIRHALLLSVANPTMGMIRFRLSGADLRDFGARTSGDEGYTLHNVRVDFLGRVRANVRMIGSTSTLVLPDMVELEAVEDALFDIGGAAQSGDPKDVEKWDAAAVLKEKGTEYFNEPSDCPFSTVAVSKDKAWIQLIIDQDGLEEASASGDFLAVPATMQVEIGNGSWESSLIKPVEVKDGESDLVSLRLVLAWKV